MLYISFISQTSGRIERQFQLDKSIKKSKDIVKNIFEITYELFRIMLPTLIIFKIFQELGFVDILNNLLSPLMFLVGLPEEIGIRCYNNNSYKPLYRSSSFGRFATRKWFN